MFDEKFFRMWEFYLTSCEMSFKWADQVVYQFQLTKDFTSAPSQETIFINILLINSNKITFYEKKILKKKS